MQGLPEFIPGGSPTDAARIAIAASPTTDNGPSMMERAARLRMDQQQANQQRTRFDLMAPVIHAKADADIAAAHNEMASFTQTEQMRAAAHTEMPDLRDLWSNAAQLDDPDQRVRAMSQVIGRAAKYEMVRDLKPEIDSWKNVLASSAVTARTLESIGQRMDAQKEIQTAKDAAAKELEDTRAGHQRELQSLKNQAPRGDYTYLVSAAQSARDSGDTETADLLDEQIRKRNHVPVPYGDAERIKALDQEAKAAEAEGDTTLAQAFRGRITTLTKRGRGDDASLSAIAAAIGLPPQQPAQSTAGGAPRQQAAPVSAPVPSLPAPKTRAEFDALQSGTQYLGRDGKLYRKP